MGAHRLTNAEIVELCTRQAVIKTVRDEDPASGRRAAHPTSTVAINEVDEEEIRRQYIGASPASVDIAASRAYDDPLRPQTRVQSPSMADLLSTRRHSPTLQSERGRVQTTQKTRPTRCIQRAEQARGSPSLVTATTKTRTRISRYLIRCSEQWSLADVEVSGLHDRDRCGQNYQQSIGLKYDHADVAKM